MKRWQFKSQHFGIAAVLSFVVAAIVFSGLVLRNDIPGRLIIGAAWSAVGVGWLGRYYDRRLKAREGEILDLRSSLSSRICDTSAQQERIRLARELHDSIKQQLFGISMGAAAAQARWTSDPQGAREAIDDVQRSAQEAMAEMNALLQQLSPAPLEKVGLVQALRDQCEALGYRTDAEVIAQFEDLPPDDLLPSGAQESLFRIAQEAFSNVARHARARHVRLYLGQREAGGPVQLEIQDDGRGFEVGQPQDGMGLENIRQRASALGGTLTLESAPGRGTTLCARIPLNQPAAAARPKYHTTDKVFLVGLAAGLVAIAVLFYPLYVLVPGRYTAGWPAGSSVVGMLLFLAALLSTSTGGALAARWAGADRRWRGALLGAVTGGVAGAIAFFGIGAPAASVTGGAALLAQSRVPAPSQAGAIRLLAHSVVGIVRTLHAAFWIALLAGAGLGALGGMFCRRTSHSRAPFQPNSRLAVQAILVTAAILSALGLLFATTRFAQLEPTLREGLAAHGLLPEIPFSLDRISDWLIGTPLALYLASSIAACITLWAGIKRTEDPAKLGAAQIATTALALTSLGLPLALALVGCPTLPRGGAVLPHGWMDLTGLPHPGPVSIGDAVGVHLWIVGLAGSLTMGGLALAALWAAYRRQRTMGAQRAIRAGLQLVFRQSGGAGLGSVIATALSAMTLVSTLTGIELLKLPIEVLIDHEKTHALTLIKLVRSLYLDQASAFLTTFVAAIAVVGAVSLLIDGVKALSTRLAR